MSLQIVAGVILQSTLIWNGNKYFLQGKLFN